MKKHDFSGIRNNGKLPSAKDIQAPADIEDLVEEYADSTNSQLAELEQAALAYEAGTNREENAAAIRRILHKIKGESGMVGIEDIAELCHQAEDAFEQLGTYQRPEMLLRFKDWVDDAVYNLVSRV